MTEDTFDEAGLEPLPTLQIVRMLCEHDEMPDDGILDDESRYAVIAEGTELAKARLGAFQYTQATGVPHWVLERSEDGESGARVLFRGETLPWLCPQSVH